MTKRSPGLSGKNGQGQSLKIQPFSELGRFVSKARKAALLKGSLRTDESKGGSARRPHPPASVSSSKEDERELFLSAMEGVVPLEKMGHEILESTKRKPPSAKEREEEEVFRKLQALVEGELPLAVHKTPEYVEGPAGDSHPDLIRKLQRGAFAVQAYCDLHGMDTVSALETCEKFFAESIKQSKRCVAFIHGRGLSSPSRPVLKEAVIAWLTRGPRRRLVLAYSSAPIWDGGAGVTYVLLRRRPGKRSRKKAGRAW